MGLVALGAVLIVAAGWLLVQDRSRAVAAGERGARVRAHRVRGDVASVLCVSGGLLVAAAVASLGGYGHGRLVALLPTLVGACLLAVFTAVEGTWPRPTGSMRTASVRVRRVADLSCGRLLVFVKVWGVGLLVALGVFTATASGPRQVSRVLADGQTVTAAPFPGWWFGLPVLVGNASLLVWAWIAVRVILARPAVADLGDEQDLELRRQSAGRVLGGVQFVMSLSLAGLVAAAGWSLRGLGMGGQGSGSVAVTAPVSTGLVRSGELLVVLAATVVVGGVVGCLLPRGSRRHRLAVVTAREAEGS